MIHGQPLCGWPWYQQHKNDHTKEEIDSLTIAVSCDGKQLPPIRQEKRDRGLVKGLVKSYREARK